MRMNNYQRSGPRNPVKKKPSKKKLVFGLLLIMLGLFIILNKRDSAIPVGDHWLTENKTRSSADKIDATPKPLPNVQETINNFVTNNPGEYSVVITDGATGASLGKYEPDQEYFAASLYKLYVAYLGYLDVQKGKHTLDEEFLGDWTRGECLDKMIRESHSPCAETLWIEQGKASSTKRLSKFDIKHTNMEGLTTTAEDVNTILLRLYSRRDLNDTHTELFLASLRENIYRDVLPSTLPNLTVMNKVGFNGFVEYHAVGIVILPNERPVVITLLTRNVGTKRLISLVKMVFAPLLQLQ